MKIKKLIFLYCLLILIAVSVSLIYLYKKPFIIQRNINIEQLGNIAISEPIWNNKGLALIFIDTKQFSVINLSQQVADAGVTATIIDSKQFFDNLSIQKNQCLDIKNITETVSKLLIQLPEIEKKRLIISGISEGALIPFLYAQSIVGNNATNLSIDFSVELPINTPLCSPLVTQYKDKKSILTSASALKNNWRSVWTDEPSTDTAVFIKTLGKVNTRIAEYETPLDNLLIEEINTIIGQRKNLPPIPVVEVPAKQPNNTVTLFYSGDGGWRDLDRTVAGKMAELNYSVVGIDVLRYFWEHKTPEQAAADLAATMTFYRKNWGVKSFVLTGYSFGADILPFIYNRLSIEDKNSVDLLVLIALGNNADFEIHVSGWIGQNIGEKEIAPELIQIPENKILCIYGKEEKSETDCTKLIGSEASILELSGGHHFDQDYPKLTQQILSVYQKHNIY